jgi:seryl-tRNA synthetase
MSIKEQYEKKLQAQLDKWDAEINKLKAKADGAKADGQLEYYKEIEELRTMQKNATDKLTELKNSSDDAWEDLKSGIDSAIGSLDNAFRAAVSRY